MSAWKLSSNEWDALDELRFGTAPQSNSAPSKKSPPRRRGGSLDSGSWDKTVLDLVYDCRHAA
jgi:hypothetical protein